MFERSVPEWLRHSPTPSARGFAVLAGIESMIRGMLVSVFPIMMYRAFGDAAVVSRIYFLIGIISLCAGLMVPWLTAYIPRRWMYSLGVVLAMAGAVFGTLGGPWVALALLCITVATVTVFVCFNAYVLDHIARSDLGQTETLRMFYSALAWTAGPVTGVWLLSIWEPAPFLLSGASAVLLLAVFWYMRLGNGKLISRARAPAPNPIAYLARFFAQPRLIAGWLFAVIRSSGWWVYVVYLPIFAVESGLSDRLGGIALSLTNALLFTTPLMLRAVRGRPVRFAVRLGFLAASFGFIAAMITAPSPPVAILCLFLGSVFLILLDIVGGLPFLMAVKPSERTEMSAVYSSFRDVSGILTPGMAALILLAAPLSTVFGAVGAGLLGMYVLAGRLHPLLGVPRHTRPAATPAE